MARHAELVHAEEWLESLTDKLRPEQLSLPTPCSAWDLRALLNHTLRTIDVFAAAVDGGPSPTDAEVFDGPDMIGDAPAARTRASTRRSQAAWAGWTDFEREITTAFGPMPAGLAISVATFSTAVHGWDVARAVAAGSEIPRDVAELAQTVAAQIVPSLRELGRFGREIPVGPQAGLTERLIAFTGRSPA